MRCGVRSLKSGNAPAALVLEGSLDSELQSERSGEQLLRAWLGANKVKLRYKNVHMLDDIEIIRRAMGKEKPAFVHISCHGNHAEEKRPYIEFAPKATKKDRILLNDQRTIAVFRKAFEGLPVLFSACLLGKYQAEMQLFRKSARLGPVAAFTREVYDTETMVFELLLYHAVLNEGWNFTTGVQKANAALLNIGIKGGPGKHQTLVRVF
jgi:hypothetical protein